MEDLLGRPCDHCKLGEARRHYTVKLVKTNDGLTGSKTTSAWGYCSQACMNARWDKASAELNHGR